MSPARRTSARRRMFRYRTKRTWKTIPERLKRLIVEPPYHMPREWEDKEPTFVYCETPTLLLLEALEVSTEEWPYYVGYMKRMLALYDKFTEATLLSEKDSLIAEYVLRGYDKEVLDEVQLVVEDCSEACYLSCEIVKACLEGDYSSWAHKWTNPFTDGWTGWENVATYFFEQAERFALGWLDGNNDYRYGVYRLSDMNPIFESPALADYTHEDPYAGAMIVYHIGQIACLWSGGASGSRTRYLVILRNDGHTIEIWKDGEMQQSINVRDHVAGCSVDHAHFSLSGKYLLIVIDTPKRILLFEGS